MANFKANHAGTTTYLYDAYSAFAKVLDSPTTVRRYFGFCALVLCIVLTRVGGSMDLRTPLLQGNLDHSGSEYI